MQSLQLTPEQNSAIDKIEKLLVKAKGTTNEHEAQAFMDGAQRLLEAYNLDMALVGRNDKSAPSHERKDAKLKGGLYGWQRKLWESVATLNFCRYWSNKGTYKGATYEHRVLGSQVNVLATELMANYLQGAIERITRDWVVTAYPAGTSIFIRDAIAYREGMAARLCERLGDLRTERLREEKARAERERAASPDRGDGYSLMLVDVISAEDDLNSDYVNGWAPGTTARNRLAAEERSRAWREKYDREQAAKRAADEEFKRLDPAGWAKEQARKAKEDADYWAKLAKETAGRSRRRSSSPSTYRAPKGPRSHTYYAGHQAGDSVGLDQQVTNSAPKAIR